MWKELGGGGFPSCMVAIILCDQARESHAGWFLWGALPLPHKTVSGWAREFKSKPSIRKKTPNPKATTNPGRKREEKNLKKKLKSKKLH